MFDQYFLVFFLAEELLMVDRYENFDWCILFETSKLYNMHQSKFSYLSTIKSSSAKKKTRKKMVEHWGLKQMSVVKIGQSGICSKIPKRLVHRVISDTKHIRDVLLSMRPY